MSKLGYFCPFKPIGIGKSLKKFPYSFIRYLENLSHQMVQTFKEIKSRNACEKFLNI